MAKGQCGEQNTTAMGVMKATNTAAADSAAACTAQEGVVGVSAVVPFKTLLQRLTVTLTMYFGITLKEWRANKRTFVMPLHNPLALCALAVAGRSGSPVSNEEHWERQGQKQRRRAGFWASKAFLSSPWRRSLRTGETLQVHEVMGRSESEGAASVFCFLQEIMMQQV